MASKRTPPERRMLTIEDIAGANDLREEVIDVPEWGGTVRIREWTKDREMELRRASRLPDGSRDDAMFELLALVHGVVEPEITEADVPMLRRKSSRVVSNLIVRIFRLNGDTKEERDRAEAEFPAE